MQIMTILILKDGRIFVTHFIHCANFGRINQHLTIAIKMWLDATQGAAFPLLFQESQYILPGEQLGSSRSNSSSHYNGLFLAVWCFAFTKLLSRAALLPQVSSRELNSHQAHKQVRYFKTNHHCEGFERFFDPMRVNCQRSGSFRKHFREHL